MTTDEWIERLLALVEEQANDPALWIIYAHGLQPITEAYLQQELRRLHEMVEMYPETNKEERNGN